MIPAKIGIIGNTHGVKVRPKPKTKKVTNTQKRSPFNNNFTSCPSSASDDVSDSVENEFFANAIGTAATFWSGVAA